MDWYANDGLLAALLIVSCACALGFLFTLRKISILKTEQRNLERRIAELTGRVYELEPRKLPLVESLEETAPEAVASLVLPAETQDWEAVVGTNWLNRAGALMLVVGIALFFGYSLTRLGPSGKIAIGFATGLLLLGAGVATSRRERYRNLGLSLMGSGWATIYFTGYAMHGIPDARIVDDPVLATLILLGIAIAMLAHALLMRSTAGLAAAYVFAFVSLNLSPLSTFSVTATLLLALSTIALAFRFSFDRIALAGTLLSYVSFLIRYDGEFYSQSGLANGQAILWIYWILFEAYDFFQLRRGSASPLLLPNAIGFLLASALHQSEMKAGEWALFCAIAAAMYAASSLARLALQLPQRFGAYQFAASLSAGLLAAALIFHFDGAATTFALIAEGELLVVLGLLLKHEFLSKLGAAVLCLAFGRILLVHVPSAGDVRLWTPTAVTLAALFSANRLIQRTGYAYAAGAALLLAIVLWVELPAKWVTVALAIEASGLLAIGFLARDRSARLAGLVLFLFCIGKLFFWDLRELDTLSRILSFVILGVLLMAVSWIYARYRDKLRRLL